MRLETTLESCKKKHNNEYYESLDMNSMKICSLCKKNLTFNDFSKHRKQLDGFSYRCKLCNKTKDLERGLNLAYRKSRALKKGMDFDITLEDLFLPTHCPILGIELSYGKCRNDGSPSIDRVDNSKGYIKGNVIVISTLANAMKSKATFEQLETFSKNIKRLTDYYKMQGALGDVTDIFPELKERSLDL